MRTSDNYAFILPEEKDIPDIAEISENFEKTDKALADISARVGDIDTALDSIIAIQNKLMGA